MAMTGYKTELRSVREAREFKAKVQDARMRGFLLKQYVSRKTKEVGAGFLLWKIGDGEKPRCFTNAAGVTMMECQPYWYKTMARVEHIMNGGKPYWIERKYHFEGRYGISPDRRYRNEDMNNSRHGDDDE